MTSKSVIILWLGSDNIDYCLQLSSLNSLEKVTDLSAINDTIVAMIGKALYCCVLFLVECNILVSISSIFLSIKVWAFQSFFLLLWTAWQLVMTEKLHMDMEENRLTVLHTPSLFHVYIFIHVKENVQKMWYTRHLSTLNLWHWLLT